MFEAAGIVVTEMSTPIRAPDLAFVSDRIPAISRRERHEEERSPGSVMKPGELARAKAEVVRRQAGLTCRSSDTASAHQ